jgi:hypothetical protein
MWKLLLLAPAVLPVTFSSFSVCVERGEMREERQ